MSELLLLPLFTYSGSYISQNALNTLWNPQSETFFWRGAWQKKFEEVDQKIKIKENIQLKYLKIALKYSIWLNG